MAANEKSYPGALPRGTILNNSYRILETIGRGGFGMIYRSENVNTKEILAVKEYFNLDFMHRSEADGKSVIYEERHKERFEKEKELLLKESDIVRKLGEDEYIVRIYERFQEDGTAYIVMELIEGKTLLESIREDGIWDPETVIRKFKPLMLTMEKVHDKDVLHRDLSPDNIMVRKDGTLCILDFGSANKNTAGSKKHTTVDKENYSALELRTESMKLGRYTDVFGLCGTMYFAMTGNAPMDVSIRRLGIEELAPPSKFDIKIPESAEAILMKGLELEPEDRIGDMETLYEEFDEIYPDLSEEEKRRIRIRRRVLTALAAVAALAFITVSGALFWYNRNRIRLGIIASLKTTVSGEKLSDSEYEDALDAVKERFSALGGENGYVLQSREDKTAVFQVAQASYNGTDPDWVTEYLICRPLNLFLYSYSGEERIPAGQLLQEEDVQSAVSVKEGIRIDLTPDAAEKFGELLRGNGQKIELGFDTDKYDNALLLAGRADPNGSLLIYRDGEHRVPDELLISAFTHSPAAAALEFECERAVNWEEPSASLMAGKNQVSEREIPGTSSLIYYRSFLYNPLRKGEELQFQYILKNRLDSLRIPYAIGKEAFGGELYVVKVTRGALSYEELMTLGKTLALQMSDEEGMSYRTLSSSQIAKDPGTGAITVELEEEKRAEYSNILSRMKENGEESAFLSLTDYSNPIPFVSCGIEEAEMGVQKDRSLNFDNYLLVKKENAARVTDIWCDYVVTSLIEGPVHNYSVFDLQTMDRDDIPVIDSADAEPERLFADPKRQQE